MEDNIPDELINERQERCCYCDNVDNVDGYCYLHCEYCWKIDECNDFVLYR